MALPSIMRKLFRNDGYGPLLKPEIIPFTADLASNEADVAASTGWVKDAIALRTVYVNASSGSDSNDGLTQAHAVKSIAQALQIASGFFDSQAGLCELVVAGGTYTDNINLHFRSILIRLTGNVTLNGFIDVVDSSVLYITGQYTLTVNATSSLNVNTGIYVHALSYLACDSTLVLNTSGLRFGISVSSGYIYFGYAVTLSISNADYAIYSSRNGHAYFKEKVTISGNSLKTGIHTIYLSSVYFNSGVDETVAPTSFSLYSTSKSFVIVHGNSTLRNTIHVTMESFLGFYDFTSLKLYRVGSANLIDAQYLSMVDVTSANGNITVSYGTNTSGRGFNATDGSRFYFYCNSIAFSGTIGINVYASYQSAIDIPSRVSLTGSVTGKRYSATYSSIIETGNRGANIIPGSTAGSADAATFSIYH